MKQQKSKVFTLIFSILFSLAFVLILSIVITKKADAQTTSDPFSPVNLSESGSASAPQLIIDSEGTAHALWFDSFDGPVTARFDGEIWGEPTSGGAFPFQSSIPKLLADADGNIHAFWTDERNQLLYSKITAQNFGVLNTWSGAVVLGEFVVNFSATVDANNLIHLAYIRTLDDGSNPAGIYYRSSSTENINWSVSTLLYASLYFRTLTGETSNIKITSTNDSQDELTKVFIVWDDKPIRRVFSLRSIDSGNTWESLSEVDGPKNTSGLSSPFNIDIGANEKDVVLVWQVGQEGVSCSQYSKFSNDGGDTWSESQRILKQLTTGGCPQENRIIGNTGDYVLLMTITQDQVFFTAWGGSSWSDPKLESSLGNFIDPVSLANVDLRCHDFQISDNWLNVVGCDESAGNDIWFLKLPIQDISEWFPPPTAWSYPTLIGESQNNYQGLQLVADEEGRLHAIWIEPDGIYHSQWNGESWTQPSRVISAVFTEADELTAAVAKDNILNMVWSASKTGELFFSWANSSKATDNNEWSKPQSLPVPQLGGISPDLLIDKSERINVLYAIPVNENRGVFLVKSEDKGNSWSEPFQFFNAVNSNWEMVDQTRLGQIGEDVLIANWIQSSVKQGPLALYFSKFSEGAEPFSPVLQTNNPVIWNDIIGFGSNTIHQVWQELDENQPKIFHSTSFDKGETWDQPFSIQSIGEVSGPMSITIDKGGQLHLTYAASQDNYLLVLRHWIWNKDGWKSAENQNFTDIELQNIRSISSAISTENEIFIVMAVKENVKDSDTENYQLIYTEKQVDVPIASVDEVATSTNSSEINSISPTPTPTSESGTPSTQALTPTTITNNLPTPTATQVPNSSASPNLSGSNTMNSLMGLVLGAGLVLFLIFAAVVIRYFMNLRN